MNFYIKNPDLFRFIVAETKKITIFAAKVLG